MRSVLFGPDAHPFEGLFHPHSRVSQPAVNVFVGPEGWSLRLEVPGVAAENLEIETQERVLRVTGKREAPHPVEGRFLRRERWSGEFSRTIRLPAELDGARAEAHCRNGVLTISIPKREDALPRRVPVLTSDASGGSEPEASHGGEA